MRLFNSSPCYCCSSTLCSVRFIFLARPCCAVRTPWVATRKPDLSFLFSLRFSAHPYRQAASFTIFSTTTRRRFSLKSLNTLHRVMHYLLTLMEMKLLAKILARVSDFYFVAHHCSEANIVFIQVKALLRRHMAFRVHSKRTFSFIFFFIRVYTDVRGLATLSSEFFNCYGPKHGLHWCFTPGPCRRSGLSSFLCTLIQFPYSNRRTSCLSNIRKMHWEHERSFSGRE